MRGRFPFLEGTLSFSKGDVPIPHFPGRQTMVTFRRLAAVAVFVPLLAACSPSMEEAVAQHRPAVEKVFDQIRALEGPVASLPMLDEDKVDTGGATIILDADEGEEENALYIFARDLG